MGAGQCIGPVNVGLIFCERTRMIDITLTQINVKCVVLFQGVIQCLLDNFMGAVE